MLHSHDISSLVFSKTANALSSFHDWMRPLIVKTSQQIWIFDRFSTNVPLTDKPGSWLLLANVWKTPMEEWHWNLYFEIFTLHWNHWNLYIFTWNVTLPQVIFKHFASKNQLPAFYIRGTLVKNGLKDEVHVFVCIFSLYAYYKCIDYIITKCTSKFSKVLENDWNLNGNWIM